MRSMQQKGHPLRVPLHVQFPSALQMQNMQFLLVEQLAPRSLDVARSTSLLCALGLRWVVGH
jgi:hypothetical protein